MEKKTQLLVSAIIISLTLLLAHTSWAATAYLTDSCEINLRNGPGTNYRAVSTLFSGASVEVLSQNDGWSQVRVTEEGGKVREGWLSSRYLADQPPWAEQAEALNASMVEKFAALEKEKEELVRRERELSEALQATTEKLQKLEADHEDLKAGATDYIALREQYEQATSDLTQARENVQVLTQEVENLRLSLKLKWFIAGALVLFGGWIIGLSMGRYQKKRRNSFSL